MSCAPSWPAVRGCGGLQAPMGEPGGLLPELLAGGGQVRLRGLVQHRVIARQAEAGGQAGPVAGVPPVQAGHLEQASDLRIAVGAAQQGPVERQGGVAVGVAGLPVHGRLPVPAPEALSLAQHGLLRRGHRPGSVPVTASLVPDRCSRARRSVSSQKVWSAASR